jgi:hypothetical protein
MPEQGATSQPLEVIRDATVQEIALQYIRHEFIKLFPGKPATFYDELTSGINALPQTLGDGLFWQLLAGIAEAYKFKWIYRFLTDSGLVWRLEKIRLNDIRMTGMSPFMDPILAKSDWQPSTFAKVWTAHPEYAAHPDAAGMKPEPQRDNLPIMLVERNHHLQVFDGMRRTCMAALANRSDLLAWVGRRSNPGKSNMNADRLLFLFADYAESDAQDEQTLQALIGICRMIIREHANGRQVVERALQFWDARPVMQHAATAVRAAVA